MLQLGETEIETVIKTECEYTPRLKLKLIKTECEFTPRLKHTGP